MRVGVLGPGGVGGALAVRLDRAGHDVVCVGTPLTVAAIRRGLSLEWQGETIEAQPEAVEALEDSVDLLLVTVKAGALEAALDRVLAEPALVLPLLNGLEHLERLRSVFPGRVAAGSIRIEAYAAERARIVQESPFTLVRMAFEDGRLDGTVQALEGADIGTEVLASERAVLWEKAARLAALAPATALTQRPVGELRVDPEWRATLEQAIVEACATATADGAPNTPDDQWAIIDAMPASLSSSAARDVAAGRPNEIESITGDVVRAARRLGVPTATLHDLLERCRRL
jgi:2-dehydropantoate 2-reductase